MRHVLLDEGDTLEITCTASGNPKPSITWRRSEGAIVLGRTGKLTKNNVKPGDSGNYECVAKNEVGLSRTKVLVMVRSK